jgi:uncharacterized Zn finger protein
MKCTRCSGFMVAEDMLDMRESYLPMWMRALRCIACGNIVDPLINKNKMVQQTVGVAKSQQPEVRAAVSERRAKAA